MSFWKPEADREWLLERGIAYERAQAYDEAKLMGNWGKYQIGTIAKAHLVGLGSAIVGLTSQAIDWIDRGFERGEKIGPDPLSFYDIWTESKAIGQWFLTGQNPSSMWSKAFDGRLAARERYAGHVMRAKDLNMWMDDTMACGYLANRFEEAIAWYNEVMPTKVPAVRSVKAPRHVAYLLCQRALGRSPAADVDLIAAGHRLLRHHLAEVWLHNGDYLKSAQWLQIVHGLANPHLSPAQAMLKAYDDMPTVPRPAFLGVTQ